MSTVVASDYLDKLPGIESAPFLTVLNGMRKGARLPLENRRYLVGASEDCDILFDEPGVPEQYFELLVSDKKIVVSPLSSEPVTIDNEAKVGVQRIITRPSVMRLGTVNVLISPLVSKVKKRNKKAASVNGGGRYSDKTKSRRWDKTLPVLVLLVLLMLFLFSKFMAAFPLNPSSEMSLEAETDTQARPAEAAGMAAEPTLLQRAALVDSRAGGDRLQSLKKDSVENILEALGYSGLSVELAADDVVEVSGYVISRNDWESSKPLLKQDLVWITKLDDSGIESLQDRRQRLENDLVSEGLDNKVTISVRKDTLVLLGALNKDQSSQLNDYIQNWNQTYRGKPVLKNRTRMVTTEVRGLDVMAVSITDVPLVTLRDGSKYATGSTMPGGYLLKEISIEKLILNRNNEELTLTLGSK